jgi:hypothetical protein
MPRAIKSILAYLVLVVPPFCGLLAILDFGQDLAPPRSIGGSWAVDAARSSAACAVGSTLKVAQSGPRAEAMLDATHLSLDLNGDHVVGRGGCGLDAQLAGDTLTGTMHCADCPATSFHAVRKLPAREK